jgi:hypothetical protein
MNIGDAVQVEKWPVNDSTVYRVTEVSRSGQMLAVFSEQYGHEFYSSAELRRVGVWIAEVWFYRGKQEHRWKLIIDTMFSGLSKRKCVYAKKTIKGA